MNHRLTQIILLLSLVCNPIAGLAVAVSDIAVMEGTVMMQVPYPSEAPQPHATGHCEDTAEVCEKDCCDSDVSCGDDPSCKSCLNLLLVKTLLFETYDLRLIVSKQKNMGLISRYLTDCTILPEIQPPTLNHFT